MRRILPTALSLLAFAAVAAPNRFSLVRSDSGDAEDDSAAVFSLDEATLRLACVEEAPDRAAEGAPVVAILCHGLAGRKEGALFDAVSKALRAKGVAVARFDFNGHGESEGAFGRMTVSNEVLDAETVVDYYRNVRGARVALVGHSQGGVVAALAASRLGAETVEALALLAPAGVLRDDALRGAFFGARYDPLDPPASVPLGDTGLAVGREYLLDAQETDPYAEIARYRGPLVVAHGQADTVVPWTYGQRFVDAVPGTGELVLVRPADHSFKGWEDTVAGVVADFLARSFGLAEGAEAGEVLALYSVRGGPADLETVFVNVASGKTVTFDGGDDIDYHLVKIGAGTLVLEGTRTFNGNVIISNGVLRANWATSGLAGTHLGICNSGANSDYCYFQETSSSFTATPGDSGPGTVAVFFFGDERQPDKSK